MDKLSLYKLSGLPDSFGVVLLSFSFILLLAPYLSGGDFGIFKIPIFSDKAKRGLKIFGPVLFLLCAVAFIPVFPSSKKTDVAEVKGISSPSPVLTSPIPPTSTSSSPTVSLTPFSETSPAAVASPTVMSTLSLAEQKRAAEKLGSDWFAAFLRHDVAALVQMSDLPFYIDNQIHVTQEDIRKRYEQMTDMEKSREGRPKLQLQRIQVQTIAEMKSQGYETARDRLLNSLNLNDDDFAILLFVKAEGRDNVEGIGLYTRKRGNELKLAGWWD